ncbi:hypothetical protein FRX31_025216 [Thalictrum thalictroides]|uniref:Uncharacterized protein n=1 Tax=Thalictrum thalictroides TaxID=46969 RepID=A0A7J6VLI6_THATH|nr:hypothetical protein FRX31_025216 [Thalictrum thalictroides]
METWSIFGHQKNSAGIGFTIGGWSHLPFAAGCMHVSATSPEEAQGIRNNAIYLGVNQLVVGCDNVSLVQCLQSKSIDDESFNLPWNLRGICFHVNLSTLSSLLLFHGSCLSAHIY